MSRKFPASCIGGFTLIELLVVISIIAILAAMLIPAMGMVRDGARAAHCGNNLRQVVLGMNGYAMDFDGMLPAPAAYTWGWDRSIYDYLESAEPFLCPTDRTTIPMASSWISASATGRRSYSVPALFSPAQAQIDQIVFYYTASANYSHSIASLRSTSSTMLLLERQSTDNYFGQQSGAMTSWTGNVSPAHRQKSNYGFADGHVQLALLQDSLGTGTAGMVAISAKGWWTTVPDD